MTKEQALLECTVEGNVIKLPEEMFTPELYKDVKKAIEGIGGKWKGGKVSGFVFAYDPSALLSRLQNGEFINLKQKFQFFGTPQFIAEEMVGESLTYFGYDYPITDVLEPSAGQGALLDAVKDIWPDVKCTCIEMMVQNAIILRNKGYEPIEDDFLKWDSQGKKFDLIVANPPFSKNQDIDHIMKMYSLLKHEGMLVTLSSTHWEDVGGKKEDDFKEWIKDKVYHLKRLPAGYFKESGTNVETNYIVLTKKEKYGQLELAIDNG
jgi:hypothetical protein